ncbi:hypothetical protein AVEN_41512-1 [Araneus ventricosus]|uniref:Uncharacterized protein n=1 Tax=Araneus ventricosus TaxID=182803 RepID=A0A4Y2IE15_ARAVE|nr:hypothetical protein AVEN_41512-1 [Araneus ventricosus]
MASNLQHSNSMVKKPSLWHKPIIPYVTSPICLTGREHLTPMDSKSIRPIRERGECSVESNHRYADLLYPNRRSHTRKPRLMNTYIKSIHKYLLKKVIFIINYQSTRR